MSKPDRPLRLLLVSMHYKPEPCDLRISQLAVAMGKRGYQCTTLTTFPNYPFGKTYDGYKQRLVQKESHDGVSLVRVPMFPDHSKSKKKRALSYGSFLTSAATLGPFVTHRPDVVWVYHPPLTTALAGYHIAKLKRVPFIYEIHDLWPETLISSGVVQESRITRWIDRVCRFLYRKAAAIVVTSPGMRDNLVSKGVPVEKIKVIYQWADDEVYRPTERDPLFGEAHALAGKFNVIFAGNLGVAQGLDTMIESAKLLRDKEDIQFVVLGEGVEADRLKKRVADEGIENVRFLGHFAPFDMPAFFSWADALLVHLKKDPLFDVMIPGKLQSYMASGRPILCAVSGAAADIVREAKAGVTCPSEDPAAMAEAVLKLRQLDRARDELSRNARAYFEREFAEDSIAEHYDRLFKQVAAKTRPEGSPAEGASSVAVES